MRRAFAIRFILGLSAAGVVAFAARPIADVQSASEIGEPLPQLTRAEYDLHVRGRRLFRWELWRPDANSSGFNANECSKCHLEPTFGGSSVDSKNLAAFVADPDATTGFKASPRFKRGENRRFVEQNRLPGTHVRRAPALFGLGLFEAVPESTLVALADPTDANGDGISGRTIRIDKQIGRFGWKSGFPTIESFVIGAFKGELGMNVEAYDRDDFLGLSGKQIRAVTFYCQTISPPPTPKSTRTLESGRALFTKIGCASCHTPSLTTGSSKIAALDQKRFSAYTDLLLHEMESASAEKATGPQTTVGEYRTAPLWGLGSFVGPYWHDGSAPTIDAAVRRHEGEARASRSKYEALAERERQGLLDFLKSL